MANGKKRILLSCGSGIVTSAIARKKVEALLDSHGYAGQYEITQVPLSAAPERSRDYDFIVATSISPSEIQCPYVNGVKKENIQVIFFHQIDSKTAAMRPTFCPGMTCAKDMHDMSNYMDIVITLGRRDVNNVCWISSAKSRRGAPISRTIQLIGEKSRFVTAKGWIPNRDGNFYKPSEDYQPEGPDGSAPGSNAAFSREID